VEETSDIGKLEIATEREIQRGLSIEKNLSQSWEDLSLVSSQYKANIFVAHETTIYQTNLWIWIQPLRKILVIDLYKSNIWDLY
jgi:hypothetical protein